MRTPPCVRIKKAFGRTEEFRVYRKAFSRLDLYFFAEMFSLLLMLSLFNKHCSKVEGAGHDLCGELAILMI